MADFLQNSSYSIPNFTESEYVYNYTTVKKLGDSYIKLITMRVQRTPGSEHCDKDYKYYLKQLELNRKSWLYELELNPFTGNIELIYSDEIFEDEYNKAMKKLERNEKTDSKMSESLIRSKRCVFEYAFSNSWDYFATFTIDSSKFDRYDLNEYHTKFAQWLRDYFRKKFKNNVQYLCIPEMHRDGAWHEHALIKGIDKVHLNLFTLDDKLPNYIRKKLLNGEDIYDCPAYRLKFGFCAFEPVRNNEACAKYITKYITKDLNRTVTEFGAKIYYVSRGLKKAEILKRGYYQGDYIMDFENQYCKQATFAYSDDFADVVCNKIKKKDCV